MKSSITIRDVAKRAGVGVGTVSRVLNKRASVSKQTREKVLAAITELDYEPNVHARRLSLGKTMLIGVILPFFTNPSYVERLRGIESILAESEYDMILFNADTRERRDAYFRDVPRRDLVDGVLIVTHTPADEEVDHFRRAKMPVVLIDACHSELSSITIDDVAGGYLATQHLIQLGHERIAFISDYLETQMNLRPVRDRHLGYYQALDEVGIPYRADYHKQGPHGRLPARLLAHELLTMPDPPTAIFAYSDTQAIGALEAAWALGLRVPEDLSIIGFDDIEAADYLNLTTVRQRLFASGVEGCQKLLAEMTERTLLPRHLTLPTKLIVRSTTARNPASCRN